MLECWRVVQNMIIEWTGLREDLHETIDFPIRWWGYAVNFPLIQSIESLNTGGDEEPW